MIKNTLKGVILFAKWHSFTFTLTYCCNGVFYIVLLLLLHNLFQYFFRHCLNYGLPPVLCKCTAAIAHVIFVLLLPELISSIIPFNTICKLTDTHSDLDIHTSSYSEYTLLYSTLLSNTPNMILLGILEPFWCCWHLTILVISTMCQFEILLFSWGCIFFPSVFFLNLARSLHPAAIWD